MMTKNGGVIVRTVAVLLALGAMGYALTDAEKLELLEERFLKGEISEKLYSELKAKYAAGSKTPAPTPAEVKSAGEKTVTPAAPTPKAEVPPNAYPPIVEVAGNLLVNPSFEEPLEFGFPKGWGMHEQWKGSLRNLQLSLDPKETHGGAQSLRFEVTGGGSGGINQKVPVEAGKVYMFTFWAKSKDLVHKSDGAPIIYEVTFLDSAGKAVGKCIEEEVWKVEGSKDWMKILGLGTAPDGATHALIVIRNYSCLGTAWIDDCAFVVQQP